jgi:hypothetical protein
MKENRWIDPYKIFVNDSFNWTNANLELKNALYYKHKERRIKELAWLPLTRLPRPTAVALSPLTV